MDDSMIPSVNRNRRKSSLHYGNVSCTNLFQPPSIKEFIVLSGSAGKPERISRNSVFRKLEGGKKVLMMTPVRTECCRF